MPYEGSMLDRALAVLESKGEALDLGEIADELGVNTARGKNSLSCALRRGAAKKLITRTSICIRCGHAIEDGRGKASLYELAPDFAQRVEEVETRQKRAQRKNILRAQAIYTSKHQGRAA